MADDDGRPSFEDVVDAMTPPGTNWAEFKAAMREVHRTGGHRPGGQAPDISMDPSFKAALAAGGIDISAIPAAHTCPRCDHPHGGPPGPKCLEAEAHLGRSPLRRSPDLQLDAISGPQQRPPATAGSSLPADPMTPGALAATAMHEAFLDLMAGGFTEDQALTILARAFAARNGSDGG